MGVLGVTPGPQAGSLSLCVRWRAGQAERSWEVSLLCLAGVAKIWARSAPERERVPIPSSSRPLRRTNVTARQGPGKKSARFLLPFSLLSCLGSILPWCGLLGIACAVFMAALIKYPLQSAPRTTLLPETRLGCDVPSPSRNVTAAVLGNL